MNLNGNKTDIDRENLAMRIVLIKEKQVAGKISFDEFLADAVDLIKKFESK